MNATEELRSLLDERGVEWMPSVFDPQHETFYSVENGVGFIVTEFPEIGRMSLACDMRITPAQAIAATLGSERERELESLAADMFCWLVDYLTPAQTQAWETRLEELNVPPTWGVRS